MELIKSTAMKGQSGKSPGTTPGETETHLFRLYVADETPNSLLAKTNLQSICRDYLPGHSQLEEVDILREPLRCLSDGILVTPTLIRLSPLPELKILGDLSDKKKVLLALGLEIEPT